MYFLSQHKHIILYLCGYSTIVYLYVYYINYKFVGDICIEKYLLRLLTWA